MHAGMFAAEAIVESLKADPESVDFSAYETKVRGSEIEKDLYRARNVRQYGDKGFVAFGAIANAWLLSGGALPPGHKESEPDSEVEVHLGPASEGYPAPDGELTFDKLGSVFLSGNATRDDAPNHVRIQTHVPREVAQTWVSMCPAQVYEIPEDQLEQRRGRGRRPRDGLQLRPVRSDQRQGRAPDHARGRRRAPLPRGLTGPGLRARR